ncbi:MAG: DUF4097 domain-containing protein [Lachnospiraceae bacterium]|nr:DUF4097 domain-containing protein [Lachnospiraceae bacterium]
MKTKTAKIYITLLTIVTIIAIIIGVSIHVGGIGFSSKVSNVSNTESFTGDLSDISLDLDAADISIKYGDSIKVDYNMPENNVPDISLDNGELTIKDKPEKNRWIMFGFNSNPVRNVDITIPSNTNLDNLSIVTDAGKINLDGLTGKTAKITSDAGDINFSNITLDSINIESDAGKVNIDKSKLNNFVIDVDAGDVNVNDSEFNSFNIQADAGDIGLSNSTINSFTAESDAGNVEAEDCTINGGSVKTDFGNIELNGDIKNVNTKTDVGNVKINGKSV